MGGMRPGPLCISFGDWVDPGTTCVTLSPVPIVVGLADVVVREAKEAVASKLQELRHDVEAALAYIDGLPDRIKRDVAYEFFAGFFDHYLPRKFLRQYIWGQGQGLVLTEQEMIDCNPFINVLNCQAFQDALKDLGASHSSSSSQVDLTCPAAALTNGTLGQFSVKMRATVAYRGANDWELSGQMSFYDEWNFDPKDFSTGGRSGQGEIKTRFAHHTLPGESFKITSKETDFSQRAADPAVVWKGGTPVAVPDTIAKLDVELKSHE